MPDKLENPTPSKFKQQALIVAVVLIILGGIVFFLASAVTGGIIALLGAIFGLSTQVIKSTPPLE